MALFYDIRVDVSSDDVIDSGYHFTQGDSRQIFLRVAVMNGTSKYNGSDASRTTINFRKLDGQMVEGIPTLTGDVYQYQLMGNELQYPGKVLCDIKFEYASGRISTGKFYFVVDLDTTNDTAIKSTTYLSTLEQSRQDAAEILGEMNTSKDSIKGYSDAAEDAADRALEYASGDTGSAKFYAEQAEDIANDLREYAQDFRYISIAYSANADGSSMTSTPNNDSKYIGVYTGPSQTAPTTASSYTWSRYRGADGNGSDWSEVANKPFNTLSSDFRTDSNALKLSYDVAAKLDEVDSKMDVPASAMDGQVLTFNGSAWVPGDLPAGDWDGITDKPFETLGTGLSVNNDALNVVFPAEKTWNTLSGKPFASVSSSNFKVDNNVLKLSDATVNEISAATGNIAGHETKITNLESAAKYIPSCDAYNSAKQYKKGELCIYNNVVYKFLKDTGIFPITDNTSWQATTLGAEFESVQGEISTINTTIASMLPSITQLNPSIVTKTASLSFAAYNYRGLLIVGGQQLEASGMFLINATGNGTLVLHRIDNTTGTKLNMSYDSSTKVATLSTTSSYNSYPLFLNLNNGDLTQK